MADVLKTVFLTPSEISGRVFEMAGEISRDYTGRKFW